MLNDEIQADLMREVERLNADAHTLRAASVLIKQRIDSLDDRDRLTTSIVRASHAYFQYVGAIPSSHAEWLFVQVASDLADILAQLDEWAAREGETEEVADYKDEVRYFHSRYSAIRQILVDDVDAE